MQKVCFEWCIVRDNLQKIVDGTKKQEACNWWLSFIEEVIYIYIYIYIQRGEIKKKIQKKMIKKFTKNC